MTVGRYPATRLRRNRQDDFTRRLVAEHRLHVDDLIWPIFFTEGAATETEVASMPGVRRVTLDRLAAHVEPAARLGIPALALFPMTPPERRDAEGTEAGNPDNLICRAARLLRAEFPQLGLIGDVALDPYTDHGHDGVFRGGVIDNDDTVAILVRQSLNQAAAGIDILAPSDMMDGRIGAHPRRPGRRTADPRPADELRGQVRQRLLRPVPRRARLRRPAARRQEDLPDGPGNGDEALREVELDLLEGADMVMVKPGMPYLDIIRRVRDRFARAHLRLPGLRRVRDDHGRRRPRLDRPRRRHDGEPAGVQARRRQRRADLLRPGAARMLRGA